jgi:hypothetical protein
LEELGSSQFRYLQVNNNPEIADYLSTVKIYLRCKDQLFPPPAG